MNALSSASPLRAINCPACDSPSSALLFRSVQIYRCPTCRLEFAEAHDAVIETPNDFFEAHFDVFDQDVAIAKRKLPARKAHYERLLGRELRTVVEIGCGTGAWAPAWQALGVAYTGVEFIPEIADEARRRTGADIRCGEFTTLEFERFDVATAFQVVEHIGEPRPFMQKMRQTCDLFHFDVPNHDSLVSRVRKLVHPRQYGFIQPPEHLRAYTAESLRELLERSGFSVAFCGPVRNDDPLFGQLGDGQSALHRTVYAAADLLGMGSLLVAVALSAR